MTARVAPKSEEDQPVDLVDTAEFDEKYRVCPRELAEYLDFGPVKLRALARRMGVLRKGAYARRKREPDWMSEAGAARVMAAVRTIQGKEAMLEPKETSPPDSSTQTDD